MAFIDNFHDLMPDVVLAQPGALDGYGAFIPSGALITIEHARIEGRNRLVRTGVAAQQVVSSVQVYLGGAYDLTTEYHRYYLPERFIPSGDLTALAVERVSDESGPVMEVLYFP